MKSIVLIAAILLGAAVTTRALNDDFIEQLKSAREFANRAIRTIFIEWQVDKFPNFLKSCSMAKSSWDLMKHKFMNHILLANEDHTLGKRKSFVISFLGSSVAAGHDSHFNYSYPIVVGHIMRESFAAAGIDLVTRNVALGNNPCMPYDVCVKIFAGLDADMVHWEQTYNCGGSTILEQFVRQAMTIPTQPMIVFSESPTAHWGPDKCTPQPAPHVVTAAEKELLSSVPIKIVSELNKDEFKKAWGILHDIAKAYRYAGVQTFTHSSHEPYACQGPYIKDWEKGAAAWHPSIVAHKLRASHHAYFWLVAFRDALSELILAAGQTSVDAIKTDVHKRIDAVAAHSLAKVSSEPIHKTDIPDNVTCFSNYEPRSMRESSLTSRVIGGLTNNPKGKGWKHIIYENLVHENLVKQSRKMGYLDFKHLLYAEQNSGPLSLLVPAAKEGPVYLCETPGIWGALPEGFKHLWETKPKVFLTENVTSVDATVFAFAPERASLQEYDYKKEYEICIRMKNNVRRGQHVITIVPTAADKIILAWVIMP